MRLDIGTELLLGFALLLAFEATAIIGGVSAARSVNAGRKKAARNLRVWEWPLYGLAGAVVASLPVVLLAAVLLEVGATRVFDYFSDAVLFAAAQGAGFGFWAGRGPRRARLGGKQAGGGQHVQFHDSHCAARKSRCASLHLEGSCPTLVATST